MVEAERKGVVICNPTAGRGKGARCYERLQEWLGANWTFALSEQPGHCAEMTRQAVQEGVSIVAAAGGDGTVSEVASSLWDTDSVLGVLPVGTGNDTARNLNIPLELRQACRILTSGRVRKVDIGLINGRSFTNNAGTGFDVAVMELVNHSIQWLSGLPAYVLAILKVLPRYAAFTLELEWEDGKKEQIRAVMLSVLNGCTYAAGMRACPGGRIDDGELDVLIVEEMSKLRLLLLLPRVIAGTHIAVKGVRLTRCKSLRISTNTPQPLNIDGDILGCTPATIHIQASALRVITP